MTHAQSPASRDAPVRLGIIGCGLISHAHGRAARRSAQQVHFVACASRSAERTRAWAAEYGSEASYTDYRDLLRHPDLDGVVIATWPSQHHEHIVACLEAGVRYVLCEKALTTRADHALDIFRRARTVGAIVLEGYMYRHHPVMDQLTHELGKLGRIDHIHAEFNMREAGAGSPAISDWRRDPEAGGGVPFDFACYPVDAIDRLAGAPPIRASGCGFVASANGTVSRLYGMIEYANGCVGTVASSRSASFSQTLIVSCEGGRLELPFAWSAPGNVSLRVVTSPGFLELESREVEVTWPTPTRTPSLLDLPTFTRQIEHFAAVIRGRTEPHMSLSESVTNIYVLEALLASDREGRRVNVALPQEMAPTA